MDRKLLEIITPQHVFFSSLVEIVIIDEMRDNRRLIVPKSPVFCRLRKSEVRFLESGASEVRTVWIPGGHLHVGKGISIYTKYANWKKEKI